MQDEDTQAEEQILATKPEVEVVAPVAEPQPEQVSEPIPEPMPEPVTEPIPEPETPKQPPEPEIVPEPEPTPPVVSVPPEPPKLEPEVAEPVKPAEPTPAEPLKPTPEPEKQEEQGGIPQKVLDLTPAELDAARRLWATRTIHDTQKASVQARKEKVAHNMQRVEHFVKKYGPTTVRTVGLELGMSTRSASSYLIDLSKKGKIRATGSTTSRRYS